ncbi:MAG: PhzF family phenazine biosynthesis protein, partial [Candidatus Krumholzibacteria bacterium]|nr:PhzF family phenazine biosynthesis protein [Candidatus Krumholzibacteria bacterium]
MQQLTIKHVDAFTAEPFSGNPAGVIDGRNGLLDQLMVP